MPEWLVEVFELVEADMATWPRWKREQLGLVPVLRVVPDER